MFIVKPSLARDVQRNLTFYGVAEGEPADYTVENWSVTVPFYKAAVIEEPKKQLTKAKAGDRLYLIPKSHFDVSSRIVFVEVHPVLYRHGVPQFQRIYKSGDRADCGVVWECTVDLDLKKLPYLYEIYVVNEVLR